MRQRTPLQAFTAGLVLLAAACSDQNEPTAPSDQPELSPAKTGVQGSPGDPNALARAVPGFGGVFLDAEGSPVVYLKDAAKHGDAVQALSPFLQARGLAPSQVKTRKADFDWSALERWQARATVEALAVNGTVFVDADEASNRVRIGVEHGPAAGRVRSLIARLGIPDAAVIVEETEPVRFAMAPKPKGATLQSRVRPIVGGLQINFPGFLCTLGFNVVAGGQSSFITNSHCTNVQGGVENTPYGQHLLSADPSPIATEVADLTYNASGCPAGRVCRRSDASRAQYSGGVSFTLGRIAKTQRPSRSSLGIVGNFSITSDNDAVAVGQTVNKVGRTTGWSQGGITAVCVNTNVSGTNITQLCQNFVSATVGSGDSGSPVFAISAGNNVTLLGILWGGSGSTTYVYSPIANIEQELGALRTF
jgi:hypothetical protein